MKIKTQNYNGITVIELQGELTEEALKPFQDTASSIVSGKSANIVLDMSNVGFIDSKSLEQLLWLRDRCCEDKGQLKLAALEENCVKIMEITRLNSQFDIYDELSEAVKSFV